MRKEAYLVKSLSGHSVQCQTCEHFCTIRPGEMGKCRVRQNIDGQLNLMVYGEPVAAHVDPIEKKPLFHFIVISAALFVRIGRYPRRRLSTNAPGNRQPHPPRQSLRRVSVTKSQ